MARLARVDSGDRLFVHALAALSFVALSVWAAYQVAPAFYVPECHARAVLFVNDSVRTHIDAISGDAALQAEALIERAGTGFSPRFSIGPGVESRTVEIVAIGRDPESVVDAANTLAHLYETRRDPGVVVRISDADRAEVRAREANNFARFRQRISGTVGMASILPIMMFGLMRIPGMRGRRMDTATKASRELGLPTTEDQVPTPDVGEAALTSAYDRVFQSVQRDTPRRTIVVTSALPGDGRSSVAANLALAADRKSVV